MSDPPVTVHIPFYGNETDLRECVDSVLAQDYQNFRIIIVGDGCGVPRFRDPRVVAYKLPANKGSYYARAVMVEATRSEWTAIIDADDWVEPGWLSNLLRRSGKWDAVLHYRWVEHRDGGKHMAQRPALLRPPTEKFAHITSHTGLWRTSVLKAVGYNPDYRMGWDTLLILASRLKYRIGFTDAPLYHRVVREDSLTRSETTGLSSDARQKVREDLAGVYRQVWMQHRFRKDPLVPVRGTFQESTMHEVRAHAEKLGRLL